MTTRPHLRIGRQLAPGLIAVALFVLFAVAILRSSFAEAAGFPADESIIANIGFALLNVDAGAIASEGFLVAFIAMAVVLDAALGGAVMLASRDEDEGGEG